MLDILPLADAGDGGSVLEAVVARHDETFQLTTLASAAGELQVPRLSGCRRRAGPRLYPRPRRDAVAAAAAGDQRPERAGRQGRSDHRPASGAQADVRLDCSGATLMARLTAKSVQRLALAPGRPVYAVIKSVSFERS